MSERAEQVALLAEVDYYEAELVMNDPPSRIQQLLNVKAAMLESAENEVIKLESELTTANEARKAAEAAIIVERRDLTGKMAELIEQVESLNTALVAAEARVERLTETLSTRAEREKEMLAELEMEFNVALAAKEAECAELRETILKMAQGDVKIAELVPEERVTKE